MKDVPVAGGGGWTRTSLILVLFIGLVIVDRVGFVHASSDKKGGLPGGVLTQAKAVPAAGPHEVRRGAALLARREAASCQPPRNGQWHNASSWPMA
ncbi:hypothetical protein BN871_IQ_00130 [Paenibacillus sp. P22]|nr:hypothetical protein BN871_IQ_00130 [Paenibacillus sp. P22]